VTGPGQWRDSFEVRNLLQTNALRYQSEIVTNVQRVCLLLELAVLFWFQNRQARWIVTPNAHGITMVMRRWAMCLWLPAVVVMVDFAWLNIPGPDDLPWIYHPGIFWDYSPTSAKDSVFQPLDHYVCPTLNWGCRFLRVDHRTLIGKVWDNKVVIELRTGQPLTDERKASFEGVFLRDRTLRFADLSETRLYAADMIRIDLGHASLFRATLTGADLTSADLTGANLVYTNLTGANLRGADLTGADLRNAKLAGAHLQDICGDATTLLPPGVTIIIPCPHSQY
jgi:Pentapeptide repeats (8 copies)